MEKAELNKPFPCLICGIRLKASCSNHGNASDVVTNRHGIHEGIPFTTQGAYGSRILDLDGTIYFVICDICLLQRRHRLLGNNFPSFDHEYYNGLIIYEKWLKYIKDKGSASYWEEIKDGEHTI